MVLQWGMLHDDANVKQFNFNSIHEYSLQAQKVGAKHQFLDHLSVGVETRPGWYAYSSFDFTRRLVNLKACKAVGCSEH